MVAFAGERVLELEAPIRNEGTKATLAEWGRTQDEVEAGRRRLVPAMVRECFEYLFSKVRRMRARRSRDCVVVKSMRWRCHLRSNRRLAVNSGPYSHARQHTTRRAVCALVSPMLRTMFTSPKRSASFVCLSAFLLGKPGYGPDLEGWQKSVRQ